MKNRFCECGNDISNMRKGTKYCSSKCKTRFNKDTCIRCGKNKRVSTRISGNPICGSCNRRDKKEKCHKCGRLKTVNRRDGGNPICGDCNRQSNKEKCSICGKISVVKKRVDGVPICGICNKRQGICEICGRSGYIYRDLISRISRCERCAMVGKEKECYICGRLKIVKSRKNGKPLCENCHKLTKRGFTKNCILDFQSGSKSLHHLAFENEYDFFISEMSVAKLIASDIFKRSSENRRLRYDYFDPKSELLVELNEITHYSLEKYSELYTGANETRFNRYCSNFTKKINLAEYNNIDLIIIDIPEKYSFHQLTDIYRDCVSRRISHRIYQ